jgi:biopolymer transport protein TolR
MEIKNSPNVVPLCDILLVLLIIFMVITPMATVGIDVKLPDPPRKGPIDDPKVPIILTIEGENAFKLNREFYTDLNALKERLTEVFNIRSDKTIFVKADHKIAYQTLINTIDVVKVSGADTICVIPTPVKGSTGQQQPIPVYNRN